MENSTNMANGQENATTGERATVERAEPTEPEAVVQSAPATGTPNAQKGGSPVESEQSVATGQTAATNPVPPHQTIPQPAGQQTGSAPENTVAANPAASPTMPEGAPATAPATAMETTQPIAETQPQPQTQAQSQGQEAYSQEKAQVPGLDQTLSGHTGPEQVEPQTSAQSHTTTPPPTMTSTGTTQTQNMSETTTQTMNETETPIAAGAENATMNDQTTNTPDPAEAKTASQPSGAAQGSGSLVGAAQGDAPKDPNNPLGRPLSKDFDFMVSDEEFEEMIRLYCRDLTKRCAEGKEDPVIGRDEEVIKMSTILLQRGRSNVVLLAEGGVGKTALFSALAHYFVSPDVPDIYKGARVIDVDLTSMAAGTANRAEFEGRLKPFLQACIERNEERVYGTPIVICLDEMHTTMGSCKASSAAGVADVMKPALTAGNLFVVGATTVEEYNMYCKPDAAYDRRFQKIHVNEPTVDDTIHILKGLKKKYEQYHNLTIPDELIEWHVPVVTKFLRKRMNPDKSIMMLDAACAEALKEGKFGGELTKADCARAIGSEAGIKWEALLDE